MSCQLHACMHEYYLESISLTMLLPILILQRPSGKLKSKTVHAQIQRCLGYRQLEILILWWLRGVPSKKCLSFHSRPNYSQLSRSFSNLMFHGKVRAALRLPSESAAIVKPLSLDSILPSGKSVREVLWDNHPSNFLLPFLHSDGIGPKPGFYLHPILQVWRFITLSRSVLSVSNFHLLFNKYMIKLCKHSIVWHGIRLKLNNWMCVEAWLCQIRLHAYIHSFESKWIFLCRTIPSISTVLDTLINAKFLPMFTEKLWHLLNLSIREGGLGLSAGAVL